MIEVSKKSINDVNILTIGMFDVYETIDDRIYLKKVFNNLFSVGDNVFFFFRRQEDLTDDNELEILHESVFKQINQNGEIRYLYRADEKVFDAIAYIKLDFNFSNLLIDMFKYFYACDFFKPINELTFDEFQDYLEVNGVDDVNGVNMIQNSLTDFIFIKGLGADHIILSYNSLAMDLNFG